MTTPLDMLNDLIRYPERLVTNKHSYSANYTGRSGTQFVPVVESWLNDFPNNSDKFKYYASANWHTAGGYLTRIDNQPVGINGEMVIEFKSGSGQGTHGWPWSAQNTLPSNAVEYVRVCDHFERKEDI